MPYRGVILTNILGLAFLLTLSGKGLAQSFDSGAPPAATSYQLTVTLAGTGGGTVTSSPAGISCQPTCSNSFASGTVVKLTAVAAKGSVFTGWAGACTGRNSTCNVNHEHNLSRRLRLPVWAAPIKPASPTQMVAFTNSGCPPNSPPPPPTGICGGNYDLDDLKVPGTPFLMELGPEDQTNFGLYKSATIHILDPNKVCNPTGICALPAVAIVGNPEGKFAIFLIAQDTVNN